MAQDGFPGKIEKNRSHSLPNQIDVHTANPEPNSIDPSPKRGRGTNEPDIYPQKSLKNK
jgi:hypothetical protein